MSNDEQRNLERQRLKAGRLSLKGYSQAQVARRVGVTRASVSGWNRRLEEGGLDALRSLGARGRPASLDEHDRQRLKQLLLQGPMAQGFATDVWTVPRVRKLVIKEFEVKLSESQVWRVLKAMNFSPQRPARQARQQDEATVRHWKRQVWPRLKKRQKTGSCDRVCR
jgi:transposase